jgi:purine-binding chemotaxis protein CheW
LDSCGPGPREPDSLPASSIDSATDSATDSAAGSAPAPGEKLLVFDLASEKYAIPIHDIAQIIDLPATTPVPNAPAFLAGIFSLRGRIISIIDVARRLELERHSALTPKVIVLDIAQDHFGLLVDHIDQVVDVNLASLEPPPEGFKPMAQDFVEGVFHLRGRAVGFLNLPMFLDFDV